MRNISAVFLKQLSETFKNKTILIQFLMFPILVIIMENAVKLDEMPEHFFVKLFAVMYVGMAPLTCMSAIISEEKEKNTLRVLMMSNVKPFQYLIGSGLYIFIICMLGTVAFAECGEYQGEALVMFVLIMALGILLSILIGAIIGISCKTQMSATSITVPVMMFFSFLPMLSMFNETIAKIAKVTYSQQMSLLMNYTDVSQIELSNIIVLGVNMTIAVILFAVIYNTTDAPTS